MAQTPIPDEKHKEFNERSTVPNGIVRRVQAQQAHESFMNGFPGDDTVMMKITDIMTLLRRGEIRATYFPDRFTVISSGVIHDDELKKLRWKKEGYAVQAFGSHIHMPTDYPVYGNMDKEHRIENIEKMMEGTRWMYRKLKSTSTRTLPLVKGYTFEERAICYETLRELDIPYCAYYGAQYFGGKMGNGINRLNEDIREVVSELDLDGVLLIGLQSKQGLEKMPPEVVAAAGRRWIYESGLRRIPMTLAQHQYIQWRTDTEHALGDGLATLGSFADSPEVIVHG